MARTNLSFSEPTDDVFYQVRMEKLMLFGGFTYHIINIDRRSGLETKVCHRTTKTGIASASPCLLSAVDAAAVDCEKRLYLDKK
jgi:hypothetical protein